MKNYKLLIKYFMDKAQNLSLDYEEQEKIAIKLGLGDYFTEDIANEWFTEDIDCLNELLEKKHINEKVVELYSMIDNNFIQVSYNSPEDENGIWTLGALKNHQFWETQRQLARQFINELLKNI